MADPSTRPAAEHAFRATAWLGLSGVALGAFGAHWLRETLLRREMAAVWEKAVFYQFIHSVVMLVLAFIRPFPAAAWRWFGIGVLCFSGSLYIWALTGVRWLVFVTPVGGLCLLVGWLLLAVGDNGRFARSVEDKSS